MKVPMATDHTLQETNEILRSIAENIGVPDVPGTKPVYDPDSGEYKDIGRWLDEGVTGDVFTVAEPKWSYSHGVECRLLDDAAGLVCEPSTNEYAGRDDFKKLPAFRVWTVNGGAHADGTPYVTAFDHDAHFSRTASDTFQMARVLYQRVTEDENWLHFSISDVWHEGFDPQPGAILPDGSIRPYMLYAKYPMSLDTQGHMRSVSGVMPQVGNVSYNSQIDWKPNLAYSGRSVADYWYTVIMMMFKHRVKSSQAAFAGCSQYNLSYKPQVAETDVNRVLLQPSQAANLVVGSTVSVGDQTMANSHKILSMEAVEVDGTEYTALNLDGSAISPTTSQNVEAMPWYCGCCDDVLGLDGSPTNPTSGKEPFVLQGIELMHGMQEIMGDLMVSYDGKANVMLCRDTAEQAKDQSVGFEKIAELYSDSGNGAKWATDHQDAEGVILPSATDGASGTTGIGDSQSTLSTSTTGLVGWRTFGTQSSGAGAGLSCVIAGNALSWSHVVLGGRLSVTGRKGEVQSTDA